MQVQIPGGFGDEHPDYPIIKQVVDGLLAKAKGYPKLVEIIPPLCREAIDDVINGRMTGRLFLKDLEPTEKTYIGIRIEHLLIQQLELDRGEILDTKISGIETDIKNTVGNNWCIPPEAINHPCILMSADELTSTCSMGVFVARREYLTNGQNRDAKKGVSRDGRRNIYWLLQNFPYPNNFFATLSEEMISKIMAPKGNTSRVAELFRNLQRIPIPRRVIEVVGHGKKDPLKRVRANGGARTILRKERIAILQCRYDKLLIRKLGLPACRAGELISVCPTDPIEIKMLQKAGKID